MRNVNRIFIALLSVLVILIIGSGSILLANVPDSPPRGAQAPSYVKWDSQLGRYVCSDYEQLQREAALKEPKVGETVYSKFLGLTQDEKTTALDQAFEQYGQEWMKHPSSKAFYDPREDVGLPILLKLGIKEIPAMLDRIQQDAQRAGVLMYAVQELTAVHPVTLVDASDKGRQAWMENLNSLIRNAPDIVHRSAIALQKNPNDEQALHDIVQLGRFAEPYVLEEAGQGNTAVLIVMPEFVGDQGTEQQLKGDKDAWLKWGASHVDDLNVLKTLVEK